MKFNNTHRMIIGLLVGAMAYTGVMAAFRGCGSTSSTSPKQIILVAVDTLRYDRAIASYTFNTTQFLKPGVKYSRCYSPSPWTYPAFVSMLTGVYPNRLGMDKYQRPTIKQYAVPRVPKLMPEVNTLPEILRDNGYYTQAFTNSIWVSGKVGLDQGFDGFTQYANERCTEALSDAEEWLEARKPDEKFFLFLQLMDPHVPYNPPKPIAAALAPNYNRKYKYEFPSEHVDPLRAGELSLAEVEYLYIEKLYNGEVVHLDTRLGRFWDYIGEHHPDALVIFTSDHGEEFWEHGGFEHGHSMYDEVLHVPLWFLNLGFESVIDTTPVSTIDIMPTVLDWADIRYNAGDYDGYSLLGDYPDDPWQFHEATLYGDELKAVTHQGHRLIKNMASGEIEIEIVDPGGEPNGTEMLDALNAFASLSAAGSMKGFLTERIDEQTEEELRSLAYLEGN